MNRFLGSVLVARRSPMGRPPRNRIVASLVSIAGACALLSTIPPVSAEGVGMTVSGRISNKSGDPQQGYTVFYSCRRSATDETRVGAGASTVTGSNGEFEIVNVPSGECTFVTMPPPGAKGGHFKPCGSGEDS